MTHWASLGLAGAPGRNVTCKRGVYSQKDSFVLKDPGVVGLFFPLPPKIESNIGMPIQYMPTYTVFDLLRECPFRLTLLILDSLFSLLRFQELKLLIKTSQLEIRP